MSDNPTGSSRETLALICGRKASGEAVREELLVDRLGSSRFRLVASPGLVLNLAAGDVFDLEPPGPDGPERFAVLERGGNLCIHLYTSRDVKALLGQIESIGGWHDGGVPSKLVVLTIPAKAGFAQIDAVLNRWVEANEPAEWYYGNVYDPKDGVTPLNWWAPPLA